MTEFAAETWAKAIVALKVARLVVKVDFEKLSFESSLSNATKKETEGQPKAA